MNTTVETEHDEQRLPAYAPYTSFMRLLGKLREAQPLPRPLDPSFWRRIGFSGSLTSQLRTSLVFLGLTGTDGMPSSELEQLVSAEGESRQSILSTVFNNAYEPVLSRVDLQRTTVGQLREEFGKLGPTGRTINAAIAFFLAMARDAGVTLHSHLQQRSAPQRRPATRAQTGRAGTRRDKQEETPPVAPPPTDRSSLSNLHPSLLGLISTVPSVEKGWDKEGRERFVRAFTAILEVLYPEAK